MIDFIKKYSAITIILLFVVSICLMYFTNQYDISSKNLELINNGNIEQKTIWYLSNQTLFLNILENLLFKDHYYFTFLSEWLLYRYKQGYSSVVLFKTNQMLEKLQRYVNDKSKELNLEVIPKSVILTSETAKNSKTTN